MIFPAMIVITSILALFFILFLAKGYLFGRRDIEQLTARLRPIDVHAFRNLIDEGEEDFLRRRLPPSEFRSIHRERMLAAVEYVWAAAHNAGILMQLGEAASHSSDPAVLAAAESLTENALRLRLYAFQVIPRLGLSILIPGANRAPYRVADSYETLTRQIVVLGCLQSPARAASIPN